MRPAWAENDDDSTELAADTDERDDPDVARILLIDDDPALLDVLSLGFEDAGHEVHRARDGVEGLAAISRLRPEIVVSDVNMPGMDGFSLCKTLRSNKNSTPVVLLTSRSNDIDEVLGLELGADDYVTKPFSTRVLLARVTSLLRREELSRPGTDEERPCIEVDQTRLDPGRLELHHRDKPISLTVSEFRLIEALCTNPGMVLSRSQLLIHVRGDDSVVAPRIIDTYIRRLRRKFLDVDPEFSGIETIVGVGYRWRS